MGYQALLFCPDEKTARTVTQVLNDLDFTVERCSEPFAAVKKLMAQHFDAVVVDCDNEQNATLLFKSARNSVSNQSSLAVAVVEGQAGVAKAFRIGANLVLTKPVNVEQAKGTLRVARGLLRKGADPVKPAEPVAPPKASVAPPAKAPATVARPDAAVPQGPPSAGFQKPTFTSAPSTKPVAPVIPSIAASTSTLDLDDQDSDTILDDLNDEPLTPAPSMETKTAPSAPVVGTPKFPWQPSPKMAEPMASALRRAAEAAGQVEAPEGEPVSPAFVPSPAEKRPMSGAMFQAQSHAAAPARAPEKVTTMPVAPLPVEAPPAFSKAVIHEIAEPKIEKRVEEKPVLDTRADVAPPTFFPGGYEQEEEEGGGKKRALMIVAAVVLLACSAGYLSWKNMSGGKSTTAAQAAPTTAAPSPSTTAPPSAPASSSPRESAPAEQPQATDITLGGGSTPASHAAAATKPAVKPSAAVPEAPAAEPEVTQKLIVKSDTRHLAPQPAPQDQESVQAPSAIGLEASADTKALASISNTTVAKPTAQLVRVSQGVMEGLVLKRVQPRYPSQALQMRIQGAVQLQATISKTGDIENLKVVTGDSVLGRAALEAVRQWKYKPYYLNGDPVQIETQILVNFKLPN